MANFCNEFKGIQMGENMSLNFQQAKDIFDENGFSILRGFIGEDAIGDINRNLERYIESVLPTLSSSEVMYEDKNDPSTLFRLERMDEHDPYFKDMAASDLLIELAGQFLEDEIETRGVEFFGKAPGIGNETPPHQDGYYFMLTPPTAMTFWIALDRADEENGCMRYITGTHRKRVRPHAMSDVLGFSQGIVDFGPEDTALEQAAIVDPGDVIAHHCMTVHRTDPNPSNRPRRALGFVYFGKNATVDKEASMAYQKELFTKWEAEGKI